MSPVPQELRPEMFYDFSVPAEKNYAKDQDEADKFLYTILSVEHLRQHPPRVTDAPSHEVRLDNQLGTQEFKIHVSKTVLFPEREVFNAYVNYLWNYGVFPDTWEELPNALRFWRQTFRINVAYDKSSSTVRVSRADGDPLPIEWKDQSEKGRVDPLTDYAVKALAVLPTELWEKVQNNGLLVGPLIGRADEKQWRLSAAHSFLILPLSTPRLQEFVSGEKYGVFSGGEINKGIKGSSPKYWNALREHISSLSPVGMIMGGPLK